MEAEKILATINKLLVDRDPQRRKACEVASRRLYLDMLPYLRYRRERALERLG